MNAPPARPSPVEAGGLLELLRRRRVCRRFSSHPVDERRLRMVLEAGCWASSASNNRIHRLLLVRDRRRIDLVRAVSPGMLGLPTALVVICTDLDAAARAQVRVDRDTTTWIDVGTAAMNMMVEAEALGLGTCPTTSFSRGGVRAVLELPPPAVPEFVLQIGWPAGAEPPAGTGTLEPAPAGRRLRAFVYAERYGTPLA
ncbi:MAG TPA: nitroreductase family protein [Candidatus Dormibacteraeota bacterium]|nr:nitroreductase family protein [Candidatus Dormibacteraeota bacterium]